MFNAAGEFPSPGKPGSQECPEPISIQFIVKTPNCLDPAIDHLTEDEKELVKKVAENFIKYGETIKLQLNTADGTCTVVPVNRW